MPAVPRGTPLSEQSLAVIRDRAAVANRGTELTAQQGFEAHLDRLLLLTEVDRLREREQRLTDELIRVGASAHDR